MFMTASQILFLDRDRLETKDKDKRYWYVGERTYYQYIILEVYLKQ